MYIQAMNQNPSIVIVADSHIYGGAIGKSDEFFKMLDHFLKIRRDIVFLGDVFELWIALNGYEDELHKRFVKWCAEARTRRSVGFIEGNHEYYVDACRAGAFTWSTETRKLLDDGTLFAHGDMLNSADWKYRLMRRIFKSRAAKAFMKACAPIGPSIAERVRVALKGTNMEHRKGLPTSLLEPYAEACGKLGAKRVVIGHFHEKGKHVSKSGVELQIIPSWRDAGIVGTYDRATGALELKKWSDVW